MGSRGRIFIADFQVSLDEFPPTIPAAKSSSPRVHALRLPHLSTVPARLLGISKSRFLWSRPRLSDPCRHDRLQAAT